MSFCIGGPGLDVNLGFQPLESDLCQRSRDDEASDLSFLDDEGGDGSYNGASDLDFLTFGRIPNLFAKHAPNQIESEMYSNYLETHKVTDSELKSFKSCFINTDIQSMKGLIEKIKDSKTNSTNLKDRKKFLDAVHVNWDKMKDLDVFRLCFARNMDNLISMIKGTAIKERMELFNARVAEFDLKLLSLPSKP